MAGMSRLSTSVLAALCLLPGGCAFFSGSRAGTSLASTSQRSPVMSQDAYASASRPRELVWREGMEAQWTVQSASAPANRSMGGKAVVGPDGTIELGPYGSVKVAGLSQGQAKTAVQNQVAVYVPDAQVVLIPAAYTSRSMPQYPNQYTGNQTTWQPYQAPAQIQETVATEMQQPTAQPSLGQRIIGWFKGS